MDFGFLRLGLLTMAIAVALSAPEPHARTVLEWPLIVPTLIAPAVTPIVLVVLLLDLMMVKIMASGSPDESEKRRFRRIMAVNFIVVLLIIWQWLPFFLTLGRPS